MTAAASVAMRDLQIAYGDRLAAEIDFDVRAGEIVVLLGPSGCGKSTILRALAGLLEPVGGTAEVIDPTSTIAKRAMVFQEDALLPWRTAVRNVELALKLRGVPRQDRRSLALDLLSQVGLAGFENHLPGALSGGMRQRVQLARTLATEPSLLLMDEPFGALDAQTRMEMQELLVSVWRTRGTTVLFVTHDVEEALLLADRILLLTPRPARIQEIIQIEAPRASGFRATPEFAQLREQILRWLGEG